MANNISDFAENVMLDYILRAGTASIPAAWGVGLSIGSPSESSGSEDASASGYTRQAVAFAAATAGTASNSAAVTFSSAAVSMLVSGLQIWNTTGVAVDAGSMLWRGTLATVRPVIAGDALVFAVGAIVITLD